LQLFNFIYFYKRLWEWSALMTLATMLLSAISMARAACADLVKTKRKFYKSDYPVQSTFFKMLRLFATIFAVIATVLINVLFAILFDYAFRAYLTSTGALVIGICAAYILNYPFQVIWGIINDKKFFLHDFNFCCRGRFKQQFQTHFHFFVRSPFVNIYRSASLYNYSLDIQKFAILLFINTFSLILLFLLSVAFCQFANVIETSRPIHAILYTFLVCMGLSEIFAIIAKILVEPINLRHLFEHNRKHFERGSRLYQLP